MSELNDAVSFTRSAEVRCGPFKPFDGSPKKDASIRCALPSCQVPLKEYVSLVRTRSTPSMLRSGKPSGAWNVRTSLLGSHAPKRNSLSLRIGNPPSTPPSYVRVPAVCTLPLMLWYCFHPDSNDDGREYPKTEPARWFEPLLVMTFTTPPVDWPNSASYPPVFTCTSCMKSNGVAFPSEPNTIEYEPSAPYPWFVTFTPSM